VDNLLSNSLTLRWERVRYLLGGDEPYGSHMDRALIISSLKAAEEQVANSERQIARHSDLISTLRQAGHDTASAIALLRELKQMQIQHVAERDRLRDELAALSAGELGNKKRIRRTPYGRR
jgi:hypothetical protein